MNTVFESVLSASLSGGIIIALILILRLALKKAPRRYICLLWLLAAVRLLVPLEIESSLSLQPDVGQLLEQRQEESITQEPADPVPAVPGVTENGSMSVAGSSAAIPDDVVISIGDALSGGDVTVSVSDWTESVPGIWAAVACGFLVYTLISYIVLKWKVRGAVRLDGNVYECAAISSPFLLGYLRPRIYLPVGLAPGDMEHILAHERAHIRRLDHWTKLVLFLCLAVHWFNPLVWAAYILLCRDMEMACDEAVIRDMPLECRKDYSRALVNCAANMRLVSACPVAFGEVSVKARILKVLNYRRPVVWISLICVAAIVFVAVCFLTSPAAPEPVVGMEWLRSVDAEDVASVRFTVGENPLSYTDYDAEEIPEILEFLQSCDGAAASEPYSVEVSQTRKYFYVTMKDGTVHTLVHYDDFVEIDGVDYDRCGDWLAQWPEEGRVQVDEVRRGLNALEKARTQDVRYLNMRYTENGKTSERTWMGSGDDWYKLTDDNGVCTAFLIYDGRQFWREYEYVGPSYVTEDSGWKEETLDDGFDLPWPLNDQQDPADYAYVETTDFKGATIVTLRYLPDGTLLHLRYMRDGWLDYYDLEAADGSVTQCGLMNPGSAGTGLQIWGQYLSATGQEESVFGDSAGEPSREEMDAQRERCRRALEEFQAADSYSLMETTTIGSMGESILLVWNSGDNWLRQYEENAATDTYLQYDGRQYRKYASSYMTQPWAEADLSGETDCRDSWLRQYQWDAEKTYCDYYSDDLENEGYTRIDLFVLDDAMYGGYYYMHFTLDDQGRICNVSRSWIVGNGNPSRSSYIHVYYHDGDAVASYIVDAYREAVGE